ncbi:MAG: hypothetical protein ACRDP8_07730 [Actinopolymorphaceae bacterium]
MVWSLVAVLASTGLGDAFAPAIVGAGPGAFAATVATFVALVAVRRYASRRLHGAASVLSPGQPGRWPHTRAIRAVRTRTEVRGRPRPRAPSVASAAA